MRLGREGKNRIYAAQKKKLDGRLEKRSRDSSAGSDMQCRKFSVASQSSSTQGIYGDEEEWCERNNGLDSGKTVRAGLKRTDDPVRKAGGRNRQGSRGSEGKG